MKKIIRLTESDLANMVKRIVREMEYDDLDKESDFGKMSIEKEDVANAIESEQLLDEFSEMDHEDLMQIIHNLKKVERSIRNEKMSFDDFVDQLENSEEMGNPEIEEDLRGRRSNMLRNAKMIGGAGLTAAGIIAIMSQGTTYSDWGPMFSEIHDIVGNLGKNAPLVSLGTIIGGIILGLNGLAQEKKEEEKIREHYRRRYRRH